MPGTRKKAIAVVTGAIGGMGRAAAKQLSTEGWPLLLCDLDADRLRSVAKTLKSAEVLAGDLADPGYADRLVAALQDRPIGALIHTAGLSPTMADARRIIEVNYDATVRLVSTLRPTMTAGSCAVLIASIAAHMVISPEIDAAIATAVSAGNSAVLLPFATGPDMAYPLSKRAVVKLVAHEAAAFGEREARIVSISPGMIDTGMGQAERAASPNVDVMLSRTPIRRMGTADEIASVAVFLCSPAASYVTGCDIRVDGGTLASLNL